MSPQRDENQVKTTSSAANIAEFVSAISDERATFGSPRQENGGQKQQRSTPCHYNCQSPKSSSEGLAQLSRNPNQLTRSENLRIEEAIAGLNAEFENLRQRAEGSGRENRRGWRGVYGPSDGHYHEPDRDHAGRATRRSEGDLLNASTRGFYSSGLVPSEFSKRAASREGCGVLPAIRFCPRDLMDSPCPGSCATSTGCGKSWREHATGDCSAHAIGKG